VPSFYVENFGCRATQADGAAIEEQFRQQGLDRAQHAGQARYLVLNTCAVTASAEQDARAAIRRVRRENPGCEVIVTGCYAQRAPQEIAALPGVSLVVGNSHKHNLAQIALNAHTEKGSSGTKSFIPLAELAASAHLSNPGPVSIFVSDIFAHTELLAAPVFESANERTRPNLKVQDGCNNRCSFCIIPSLRGRSRSLQLDEVVRQVHQLVAAGYREVVISGINLGRWGRDLPKAFAAGACPDPPAKARETNGRSCASTFENLVRAILHQTSLQKLRISSVEPMDWSDNLIQLMAESPRIAKHAHVPMQSGSDSVLRRMHRKYRPWHYREKIEKIRAAVPNAAIGADVMVGFPGETDSEFDETRLMIEELPLTYLHVFTFSPRPGTPAASMPGQVPVQLARERNRVLRELAAKKKREFMRSFVGGTLEVITLSSSSQDANGTWTEALSDNFLNTKLRGRHRANLWLKANIVAVEDSELIAVPLQPAEILVPGNTSSSLI
jgi:threonylcarbamoyladenosine tRNA methylthiotransferase MtaB